MGTVYVKNSNQDTVNWIHSNKSGIKCIAGRIKIKVDRTLEKTTVDRGDCYMNSLSTNITEISCLLSVILMLTALALTKNRMMLPIYFK